MSLIKENNIRFDPECRGYLDDVLFSITVANHMKSFYYGMEYVYNYRINENSLSQKVKPNDMIILNNSLGRIERYIHDNHLEDKLTEPYNTHVVRYLIHKVYVFYFNQNREDSFSQIRKELLKTISTEPYNTAIKECKLNSFDSKRQVGAVICLKMHSIIGLRWYVSIVQSIVRKRNRTLS